jgi:hypothetical protein
MNEREVKMAARARAKSPRCIRPGVAHCDCDTCTCHPIPADERAEILRAVRALQADIPFRFVVTATFNESDAVYTKRCRSLSVAKWERAQALEQGAVVATIREEWVR